MSAEHDASELADGDLTATKLPSAGVSSSPPDSQRESVRKGVDSRQSETRSKLAELNRIQDELERKRAALEEARRRTNESQDGQQEMVQNLTRELGLLEETELEARQEAGQMARRISEFRDALRRRENSMPPLNVSPNCDTFPQAQRADRMGAEVSKRSFREAVCGQFGCSPGAYAETVFRRCLYRHAVLPAWIIRRFIPDFFHLDFELIRIVATFTHTDEVWGEIRLHRAEHPPIGFLRRNLRMRVSFQRLLDLSTQLLAEQPTLAPGGTTATVS